MTALANCLGNADDFDRRFGIVPLLSCCRKYPNIPLTDLCNLDVVEDQVGPLSFLLFRWRYSSIQSLCYASVIAGLNVIETGPECHVKLRLRYKCMPSCRTGLASRGYYLSRGTSCGKGGITVEEVLNAALQPHLYKSRRHVPFLSFPLASRISLAWHESTKLSEMPRVRYAPLRSTASIRVLIVQPGDENSPISGSFAEIDLAARSIPAYECLSYTWGEAGNEVPIWIDGRELLIRQNLYAFIVRLRKEEAPITSWADFICIDQQNLKEKTQQVQMMGAIYSQAITVRVWVGEHADRSEELFYAWPERTGVIENLRRTFGMLLSHKEQAYRKAVWAPFLARTYWTRT